MPSSATRSITRWDASLPSLKGKDSEHRLDAGRDCKAARMIRQFVRLNQRGSQKAFMKRLAKATFVGCCMLMLIFCAASTGTAQRSLTKRQARQYVRNLPAVDRIEISQFDSDPEVRDHEVVGRKVVEGTAARKLAALWRTQTYAPDRSACHEPSYAVRFYARGKELFYASVCWGCNNILFFAPDFIGGLHFEGESKNGERLYKMFQEAFSTTEQTKSSKGVSFNSDNKRL